MISDDIKHNEISVYNQRILSILDNTIRRVNCVGIIVNRLKNSHGSSDETSEITKNTKFDVAECSVNTIQEDQLNQKISKILESLDKEKLPVTNAESSPACEAFVKCLTELRLHVASHQGENAAQERVREDRLRRSRLNNEQALKEIAALESDLLEKKSEFNANVMGKNLLINRQQNRIEKIRKVTEDAIESRMKECEAIIKSDKEACDQSVEILRGELEEYTKQYNAMLSKNLEVEKRLRFQRTRLENQLAQCMEKFDEDMEEKQTEEEQLQAELEQEKKNFEEIQSKLDEQEEEYDELMQEKAAYEQQLVEQKLFLFILNRSARRIQRAYRAYKLRKLAKKAKKGKKGKGKKK